MSTTSATSVASASSTSNPNNPTGVYNDGQSRPLLFFVALGFGVVFTNLWIIVGVKYCFRYNQRARQLAALEAEGGDGVDLGNMQRPRRRREKKLMSMEDVNTRFPLTKYKIWRASRENQGLTAAGGVVAPASRAASIKEAIGLGEVTTARGSVEVHRKSPAVEEHYQSSSTNAQPPTSGGPSTHEYSEKHPMDTTVVKEEHATAGAEEDEEDDPIQTAVPADLIADPGDACAICLDTLEDDDEVRGLTCGHAFHAGCLDPWLTGRRACCPLCKADYYVPKPRTEADTAVLPDGGPRRDRMHPLSLPTNVWMHGRGIYRQPRMVMPGAGLNTEQEHLGFPYLPRESRFPSRRDMARANPTDEAAPQQPRTTRIGGMFSTMFTRNSRRNESNGAAVVQPPVESEATPGQLEAGTR